MHYMDTHVGSIRGGQAVGGSALSQAGHDMLPCASTRPAEHPLTDWQRAVHQTHVAGAERLPTIYTGVRTAGTHPQWNRPDLTGGS